jgi:hypothetical protein
MTDANIQEFLSGSEADEFDSEAAGELFSRCFTAFCDDLPQDMEPSFREYESAQAMLDDLRLLLVGKSDSRLMKCYSKVESFSRNLAPYFDIVNVFVQIKPDCVAGFWGSLMLVCKVCLARTFYKAPATDLYHCEAGRQCHDIFRKDDRDVRENFSCLAAVCNIFVNLPCSEIYQQHQDGSQPLSRLHGYYRLLQADLCYIEPRSRRYVFI